jgi:hypothetical protein
MRGISEEGEERVGGHEHEGHDQKRVVERGREAACD